MFGIGYFTTVLACIGARTLYSGFALSKLWAWFISPTFNAPELNIAAAIGITLTVSYLTMSVDFTKKSDPKEREFEALGKLIVNGLAKPTFALAFGFVYAQFM